MPIRPAISDRGCLEIGCTDLETKPTPKNREKKFQFDKGSSLSANENNFRHLAQLSLWSQSNIQPRSGLVWYSIQTQTEGLFYASVEVRRFGGTTVGVCHQP